MTRTLFLHLGHPKTGSSYLQSSFVHQVHALASAGIAYPMEADADRPFARVGIGNAAKLRASTLPSYASSHLPHLLLSSEILFNVISAEPSWPGAICEASQALGFRRVKVLMFVRDPHEWVASFYLQNVKRRGETRSFGEYAHAFKRLDDVANVLDALTGTPGLDVHVVNYSRCKRDLIAHTWAWLGVTPTPDVPAVTVNRSLDAAEMQWLRLANRLHPQIAYDLSTRWIEELHDHPSHTPFMHDGEWEAFRDRIAEAVRRVDRHLPPEERYRVPDANPFERRAVGRLTPAHWAIAASMAPSMLVRGAGVVARKVRASLQPRTTSPRT